MSEQTATSVNHEEMKLQMAFHCMSISNPIYQAEKIARHYLRHVIIAQQIEALVRARVEYHQTSPEVDQLIDRLASELKAGHAHDLGIKLDWNLPE